MVFEVSVQGWPSCFWVCGEAEQQQEGVVKEPAQPVIAKKQERQEGI